MLKVVLDTTTSYNHGDGVFTTPMTGIYVFTWTASVNGGNWETTELVVDGTPYAYSFLNVCIVFLCIFLSELEICKDSVRNYNLQNNCLCSTSVVRITIAIYE
jgi:hypothetical protein